jgi:tetratricopeptide (TPR) repeat protein
MRLLHFNDVRKLVSTDFSGKQIPPYAILSHRWNGDTEVLFEDLENDAWDKKLGGRKIEFCAEQAAQDQLEYFWIDTCCIDKWNLRELSKAINSMFEWYQKAAKCYVFLTDVSAPTATDTWEESFRASEWFTRGWTLQELIAPVSVEFFSREGRRIGDKTSLEQLVHEVTRLPLKALRNSPLDEFTISERMEWASNRRTTEEEDSVYCLLGILGFSLTPSYGEGKEKALQRLQMEMEPDSSAPAIIPFAQNNEFTGRESELAELEAKLVEDKPTGAIVIVGPEGTGKSQLALELTHRTRHKNTSCSVFWVDASDLDSLEQGYSSIAKRLDIPGWDDEKADAKQLVKHHLSREGAAQSLLIFDNADGSDLQSTGVSTAQTADLADYLPQSPLCSIIITTTNSDMAKRLASENSLVELGKMRPDTAQRLLKNHLNPMVPTPEQREVEMLVQELSYLPLAIVQAAAFINTSNGDTSDRNTDSNIARDITLEDYRLRLVRQRKEALEHSTRLPKDTQLGNGTKSPVTTTLLISLDQIHRTNKLAADYLFLAACVGRKDIPINLLEAPLYHEKEDAIRTLSSYALITRRPAESALDLHQLVHRALREWLQTQGWLDQWTQKAITQVLRVFPGHDHGSRSKWRRLLPHAKYTLAHSLAEQDGGDRSKLVRKCALTLFSDGRYNEAEEHFVHVMEADKKELGADHPDTLISISNVAATYRNQGRWEAAEELDVQVMETTKKKLGADHIDTLISMANLAATYTKQGRWEAAEELQVEAMETTKKKLGADHLETLASMSNLAVTYRMQGRWEAAEELQVQVMETRKKQQGADNLNTLTSMSNLAMTYRKLGRWEVAEELLVQVTEARKKKLGADHPETLASMSNLAATYRNRGRWEAAEELEVQIMEAQKKNQGAEHPSTLASMSHLALTYRKQGRWEAAEELEVQVMEAQKKNQGAEHPSTLASISNLALTYRKQGRWEAAEELQVQLVETFKKNLGAEHPSTLIGISSLAVTYRIQGQWEAAKELQAQVMEIRKKKLGADHPATITSMSNLALTYRKLGRREAAEELQVQVMETLKKKLGAGHPDTLISMSNLAFSYREQGRCEAAEELDVQVMEARKKKLGADHPDTLISMNNLAFTWKAQGRDAEAIKLMTECEQLRRQVLGASHPHRIESLETLTSWETE